MERPYEYPVYTLAGAVIALSVPSAAAHVDARDRFVADLRRQQLGPENGWSTSDPPFGGFGYWHDVPVKPDGETHELLSSNLSATLWAVGALQLAGVPREDAMFKHALAFVERCRLADGGFLLTPTNDVQNKAGPARSYASATADGLRALHRLAPGDPRVADARRWLAERFDGARNAGDFPADRAFSQEGSRFYATWSMAHAFVFAGGPEGWAERIADDLLALQHNDGTFSGGTDLREDDPYVATPLAMGALALARFALTKQWRAPLTAP